MSRYHRLTLSHSVLLNSTFIEGSNSSKRDFAGTNRNLQVLFLVNQPFFYKVKSVNIALSQFHIQEKIYEQQTFKGSKNPTLAAKIRGEYFILSL